MLVSSTSRASTPAMLVLEVAEGSAASRAGVMVGDVVVGIGGRAFGDHHDLFGALARVLPGQAIPLDIERGGVGIHVQVRVQSEGPSKTAENSEGQAA